MSDTKSVRGENTNQWSNIELSGLKCKTHTDTEEKIKKALEKAGSPNRAYLRHYKRWFVRPQPGDILQWSDGLDRTSWLIVSVFGIKYGSQFKAHKYTSEAIASTMDEIVKHLAQEPTFFSLREFLSKDDGGCYSYVSEACTFKDPLGHG